jgi:hypothetical protein
MINPEMGRIDPERIVALLAVAPFAVDFGGTRRLADRDPRNIVPRLRSE